MLSLLAKAEGPDPNDSNLTLVLITMITVGVICMLAAVPVVIARKRRRAPTEGIAAVMVLWGIATAGSIIYFTVAQMRYSKEYTMRIMQNYDPADQSDQPARPWILWTALAVAYGGTLIWSASVTSNVAMGFPIDPLAHPPDSEKTEES